MKQILFLLLQIATVLGQYIPPTLLAPPLGSDYQAIPAGPTYISTNLYLFCKSDGDPAPLVYIWKYNGVVLNMNQNNIKWNQAMGGLNISAPVSEGTYQCTVTNKYNQAMAVSNVTQVITNRLDIGATTTDSTFTTGPGSALTLPCVTATSNIVPGVVYDWQTVASRQAPTSTKIFLDSRVQIDSNGGLNFAFVKASDATSGTVYYRCHLQNSIDNAKEGSLSYSKLTVSGNTVTPSMLTLQFSTPTVYGLIGQTAQLCCFFSGAPDTVITWSFIGQPRTGGRFVPSIPSGSTLTISLLDITDAGVYTCSGRSPSTGFSLSSMVTLVLNAVPTFTPSLTGPVNLNATVGGNVTMSCNSYAVPAAQVTWYQNGIPLIPSALPKKISINSGANTLTVSQLCKTCTDEGALSVIQCNASNSNGSVLGQGYINVLDPTVFVTPPIDQILTYPDQVNFTCIAASDVETPITYTWTFNGNPVSDGQVNTSQPCALYISINGLNDKGNKYLGTWRITISNGVSSTFTDVQLKLKGEQGLQAAIWWWIPLVAILLFIIVLLLILLCCFCLYRNRGDAYPVDVVERKHGNDPAKDLADSGFKDFQRPVDRTEGGAIPDAVPQQKQGQGPSSVSSSNGKTGSEDDMSLTDYSNINSGKYNEDGSYVGLYHDSKRGRNFPVVQPYPTVDSAA